MAASTAETGRWLRPYRVFVLRPIPAITGIGPPLFIECWSASLPLVAATPAAIATKDANRPRLEKERIVAFQKIVWTDVVAMCVI